MGSWGGAVSYERGTPEEFRVYAHGVISRNDKHHRNAVKANSGHDFLTFQVKVPYTSHFFPSSLSGGMGKHVSALDNRGLDTPSKHLANGLHASMKRELIQNLFGNKVYYTNSLILLVNNMLCSKLPCQKDFNLINIFI